MPHDDEVHVIGHHLDGILEALSLPDAGVGRVRKAYDAGSQTVGRSLETQSGPCGRLEEDAGHYLVAQECLRLVVLHLLGYIEDVQYLLFGEVLNGY